VPESRDPGDLLGDGYLRLLFPKSAAPYDPMHLFLFHFLPNMWDFICEARQAVKGVLDDDIATT